MNEVKSMMYEAMLQGSNSNDLIIPRDEFTFNSDPDFPEDVVIYGMVVEYQAVFTVKKADDELVEIKPEPQERSVNSMIESSSQFEPTIITASQITVDNEEIISAQEPTLEQPLEEAEDWTTILIRRKQSEGWG